MQCFHLAAWEMIIMSSCIGCRGTSSCIVNCILVLFSYTMAVGPEASDAVQFQCVYLPRGQCTVHGSQLCRDAIAPCFSQGLVYVGGPPARCSRHSSNKRRSATAVKSIGNKDKTLTLECSTMAIGSHQNKGRGEQSRQTKEPLKQRNGAKTERKVKKTKQPQPELSGSLREDQEASGVQR